ncbi:MAG: hypothetical protein WBF35_12915, partial [Candidatus Acidiferrales bacterium]
DYIARWLGGRFISPDYLTRNDVVADAVPQIATPSASSAPSDEPFPSRVSAATASRPQAGFDGAPTCSECGMLMTPNGACYKCENCGGTSGCS